MNVVSTSSPNPFLPQVTWPSCLWTSTWRQLSVSTSPRDAVNHSSRRHSICKSCLLRCFKLNIRICFISLQITESVRKYNSYKHSKINLIIHILIGWHKPQIMTMWMWKRIRLMKCWSPKTKQGIFSYQKRKCLLNNVYS